jgi:hypothetical protein
MVGVITPGHHAIVYVGTPAETTMTTEATTMSGAGKIFQITAPLKRVCAPTATQTQNWGTTPTGPITVNRLTGTWTSAADETTHAPLTITGKYIEMAQLLYCNDFTMDIDAKLTDTTPFGQNFQAVNRGLAEVSGVLGDFFDPTQIPSGTPPAAFTAGIANFFEIESVANAVFAIQFYVHANLSILAWANIEKYDLKAVVDGAQEETIAWNGMRDLEGHVVSRL